MSGVRGRVVLFMLVTAAVAAPVAHADEQITARPSNTYVNPNVTIDQGERLTFRNDDVAQHNVTARQRDQVGRPLFASATIGQGRTSEVEGARSLTSGSYGFFCTLHPFMTGTLTVSAAGTPLPREESDTTAPALRVAVVRTSLARVARLARLPVRALTNERASVAFTATARVGRRTITIARGRVSTSGGETESASLRLTSAGRRAVRRAERLVVRLRGRATDAAGNASTARARRTLR
jgi:plastocyanin